MAAMTSKLKVLIFAFASVAWGENRDISDAVVDVFLKNQLNSDDSEWIIKSARESYFYLKGVEEETDVNEKLNFVNNYANFLLKLFREIQLKNIDIYRVFERGNSFLKEYDRSQVGINFDIKELKSVIEEFQLSAKRHLTSHYNSSRERYEASKVLALNETCFDDFLKEKIRAEYSGVGYFLLEVFATLIGLSWGIISTILHYTESTMESTF